MGNDPTPHELTPWELMCQADAQRLEGGMAAAKIARDLILELAAYEGALARLTATSPDAASEFGHLLDEAHRRLDSAHPFRDEWLSAEAEARMREVFPRVLDETVQTGIGRWVRAAVAELQARAVDRELLESALGRALLALNDLASESAGPDRWPNVREQAYRPAPAAIDAARQALEDVTGRPSARGDADRDTNDPVNAPTMTRAEAVAHGVAILEDYARLERDLLDADNRQDHDEVAQVGTEFVKAADALVEHLTDHYELLRDSEFSAAFEKLHGYDPFDPPGSLGADGRGLVVMVYRETTVDLASTDLPSDHPGPEVDL